LTIFLQRVFYVTVSVAIPPHVYLGDKMAKTVIKEIAIVVAALWVYNMPTVQKYLPKF